MRFQKTIEIRKYVEGLDFLQGGSGRPLHELGKPKLEGNRDATIIGHPPRKAAVVG